MSQPGPSTSAVEAVPGSPGDSDPEEPSAAGADRARVDLGVLGSRFGLLFAWAAVIATFSLLEPDIFFTAANFENIFGSQATLLVLTIGLLFPLTVGEFDASFAGVLSVSLMLVGYLNGIQGWAIEVVVPIALLAGVAIGCLNAFFVVAVGVDSFVATLGMGTLLLGVGTGISNLSITGLSPTLVDAARTEVFGLQLAFYYGLALTIFAWYLYRYTPLGRNMQFIGASPEVARLAGLRVNRIRSGAFVASGLIAALAGVILAGVLGAADPNTGASFLLPTFAAAFLGATAINPGRFNPWGAFIAVYFLITGITGLQIVGLAGWIEQVFYGGALVLAVTLSRLAGMRSVG